MATNKKTITVKEPTKKLILLGNEVLPDVQMTLSEYVKMKGYDKKKWGDDYNVGSPRIIPDKPINSDLKNGLIFGI